MARITVDLIDGTATYTLAPKKVQTALRRRFDTPNGIAAVHPDKPNVWLFDVRNWWDGPDEIRDNGNGTMTYTNPWTQKSDTFSY